MLQMGPRQIDGEHFGSTNTYWASAACPAWSPQVLPGSGWGGRQTNAIEFQKSWCQLLSARPYSPREGPDGEPSSLKLCVVFRRKGHHPLECSTHPNPNPNPSGALCRGTTLRTDTSCAPWGSWLEGLGSHCKWSCLLSTPHELEGPLTQMGPCRVPAGQHPLKSGARGLKRVQKAAPVGTRIAHEPVHPDCVSAPLLRWGS